MILSPRKSVTRFCIPLIDVLILLFCIFLLMPFVSTPAADDGPKPAPKAPELPTDVTELRKQLAATQKERDEAQKRLDRFQKERGERLVVRVLEIDAATGRLSYHDPERVEVRNEADAGALVERDRKAQAGSPRELYYLILYPRERSSPYPLRSQREQYDRWFGDVPHGWDIPGQAPGGKGTMP